MAMAGQEIENCRPRPRGQGPLRLRRARPQGLPDLRRAVRRPGGHDPLRLETLSNVRQVGRNGLHRYNNADHSMLTAMRAVNNILLGANHDIWSVNVESVYHEEVHDNENPYKSDQNTPAMSGPLASDR